MWKLTVRSPNSPPQVYDLKPGANVIGRLSECDITIDDISASRRHIEITVNEKDDTLSIRDLNSRNGTFVNHQRLAVDRAVGLRGGSDTIRIGHVMLTVNQVNPPALQGEAKGKIAAPSPKPFSGTKPLTRDVLLEALDQQAVLMYEVARQLNTVMDIDSALSEVANLLKRAMGADRCDVILAEFFGELHQLGFPETFAREAIQCRSTIVIPDLSSLPEEKVGKSALLYKIRSALCVPVLAGETVLALIYMYKTDPKAPPFDQRDLQLAVSISHQAALTIQRTNLISEVQHQRQMENLLRRFLSPQEANYLMTSYLRDGRLPGLEEQKLTVVSAGLAYSSALAQTLGAWRFGQVLERFYTEASQAVFAEHGLIRLNGDGILGVFGTAGFSHEIEERAVRAGLALVGRVKAMVKEFSEAGADGIHPQLVTGVGISTGQVVAGYIGAPERTEYTVLGETVNTSTNIQVVARPNRLIIDPPTYAAVRNQFHIQKIGEIPLVGRDKPLFLYEVIP